MLENPPTPPRLVPDRPFPPYAYLPGRTPHPTRDAGGHSYGRPPDQPDAPDPARWRACDDYLYGIDLFNHGYYWEAHEEFDKLLKLACPDDLIGRFLKGLFKLAAAGLKVRENSIHGVRRHAASSGEVFADVAAEVDSDRFCGLKLTMLQFAADRAAQLTYKEIETDGQPVRVFPFLLKPEPLPLA